MDGMAGPSAAARKKRGPTLRMTNLCGCGEEQETAKKKQVPCGNDKKKNKNRCCDLSTAAAKCATDPGKSKLTRYPDRAL
jgi:hypothetical protein